MGMATDLTAPDDPGVAVSGPGRQRRVIVAGVVLSVAAAVVTAIGLSVGGSARGARVAVEGAAPMFDLPRVGAEAKRVRLADFAGRPVVVNFWASWCVPCRKEMPDLQAASQRLKPRVAFVGVNHQDARDSAAEFEREVGVRYPSGWDPDGGVARKFGVAGLPTSVLVDAKGRIVARRLGEVSERELLDLVARAFGIDAQEPPS